MTWTVSVTLLAYLGNLLDEQLGTKPLFLLIGALLGAVGGFIHFLSRVAPDMLPFRQRSSPGQSGESDSVDSDRDSTSNPQ